MRIPGFAGLPPEEVVQRAARSFIRHEMPIYAAALSYHAMLALFPFLIFLLTLLGALGLADFFAWLMRQARAALPPDAFQMVALVIGEVRDQRRVDLLSVSILFSVLAASTGVRSLMRSLTSAYDAVDPRPVWRRFLLSVIYTVGLAVLLAVAAGALLIGPRTAQLVASQLGLSQVVATLWIWLRWPLVMLLFLLTIAIIYDFGSGIAETLRFVTP